MNKEPPAKSAQRHPGGENLWAPSEWRRVRRVFMFTDIVGSTNLVDAMGDETWNYLLRWHDARLRSLFARHGGEEVNRMGDGFFVVFDSAEAAVDCAVAIQRDLDAHRREHGFSPSLRIGIHEAEATVVDGGDYRGKGVHEAARITYVAHANEIVASAGIAAKLGSGRISGPRSVSLKGLCGPIDVVSIDWESPRDQRSINATSTQQSRSVSMHHQELLQASLC